MRERSLARFFSVVLICVFFQNALAAHDVPVLTDDQETAVNILGIADFSQGNSAVPDDVRRSLRDKLVSELSSKTALKAVPLVLPLKRSTLHELNADGILVGQIHGERLQLSIANANGRALTTWTTKFSTNGDSASIEALASEIVYAIVDKIPYLGFVKNVGAKTVEINLGTANGIEKGAKLFVYSLSGPKPTFHSRRKKLGLVQVTKVEGSALSEAVPIPKNLKIPKYAKVDLKIPPVVPEEIILSMPDSRTPPPSEKPPVETSKTNTASGPAPTPPPQIPVVNPVPAPGQPSRPRRAAAQPASATESDIPVTTRFSNRFWISAGASTFSLGTEPGSTRYTDRNYQIKTTPILNFGLGANRFAFLANLGNASTDSATVGIYDFKGTYEVLTMNYSAWSLIGSVGATFQQLNPSNQTGTTPLKTISTGGPAGELAAHYRLFNSVKAIGGGDFYYPALTSDQEGLQPLSYGWSLFAALRARVTSSFNIELGTRYRYFRLPVAGDNFGFQQRFLTIDLSLYWMF